MHDGKRMALMKQMLVVVLMETMMMPSLCVFCGSCSSSVRCVRNKVFSGQEQNAGA